mgnify:CR=1 FL=1
MISRTAMTSCLGDAESTYAGLLAGASGDRRLGGEPAGESTVSYGYPVDEQPRSSAWPLLAPVLASVCQGLSHEDLESVRVVVGTGMHEQRLTETSAIRPGRTRAAAFPEEVAVRSGAGEEVRLPVTVLTGACSASGTALTMGADLIDSGMASRVVVAGADVMAMGMLGMMGRVNRDSPRRLRPFDAESRGVLLGEGAAAVLLEAPGATGERSTRAELLGAAITCDGYHETAPSSEGIARCVALAHERAGVRPPDINVVMAHATGTRLNDPTEARVLSEVFEGASPLVSAIKGATGHTSGASMLMSLIMALIAIRRRLVPPIVGLRNPLDEASSLRFPPDGGAPLNDEGAVFAQVEAFGFGGVNSVCIVRSSERDESA